jgi:prepilin-type N-terminal cleavage/methylation domain-containing protein
VTIRRDGGFSLLEVLIAMTILLMVTFIGTYGYGLYSRYWQTELGHYQSAFDASKGVNILFKTLKDLKPYVVKDREQGFHYFEGGNRILRSVTSHSLQYPDYPALFEIALEERQDKKQLVYRELSMKDGPVLNEPENVAYIFSIVLLNDVDDLVFEYYGWPNFIEKAKYESKSSQGSPQWYGLYSGKDTLITPEIIKTTIIIDGKESVFEVAIDGFLPAYIDRYIETSS